MMTSQPKTPAILNDDISRKIPDGSRISYYREFLNARSEGFSLKKCLGNTVHHAYTIGAFNSTRTFETLETAQMVQKFPGKVSEIRETVEFPKCEPLNRNFWKFSRAKMRGKNTSWKIFQKFGYTTRGCPLFWKFLKMLLYSRLEVPENSTTGVLVE